MNREWLQVAKKQKRLKLKLWQSIRYYSPVLLLLLSPAFAIFALFEIYITKTYNGVPSAEEWMTVSLPFVLLAIVLYYVLKRRLLFKEVEIVYTDEEFQEALKRTIQQCAWKIKKNNKSYFLAFRPDWIGNWGEMITIIKLENKLLINSICDPNKMPSVFSYGRNRRNKENFLCNLTDSINKVPFKEIVVEEKSEWTFKRTVTRLLIYPFCLFMIFMGTYMILKPLSLRNASAGVGAIVIGVLYLYLDIKVLLEKKHDRTIAALQKK